MFRDPAYFSWLLTSSVSLVILSLVYASLFRKWTFFTLNRWILLGGTCACLVIPLISLPVMPGIIVQENAPNKFYLDIPALMMTKSVARQGPEPLANTVGFEGLWVLPAWLYWAGVATMLARSLRALVQLRRIRSQSKLLQSGPKASVWIQSSLPTFSFGKDVFLNVCTLALTPIQVASIRRHEEGHVLQKHTIDNIFFEIVHALFWFNPFVKKLSTYLRDVHEFLADRWATAPDQRTTDYQELLVKLAGNTPACRVAHPFSDSQFFRRIVMLNKPKTNAMQRIKLLLLVPAFAAAVFISACVDTNKSPTASTTSETKEPVSGPIISKITWLGNKLHSEAELNKLLGIKAGDIYNASHFQEMLLKGPLDKSVISLYMDNGYLFFYTDVVEKQVGGKVELTVNVYEHEQVWINDVIVKEKGGGQLLSKQVRPFLDVEKGQLFNRSLLITSQEKVAKSGLVKADSVIIHPYPLPKTSAAGKRYVDIEFAVQKP